MVKERVGGFQHRGDPAHDFHRKKILALAEQNLSPRCTRKKNGSMPVVSCLTGRTKMKSFRRFAVYVDKILKGAKPAELPVEQPTKFDLVINLKAAKQIGLTIPHRAVAGGPGDQIDR